MKSTVLLALLLTGCASYAWFHPTKGQAQFNQDTYRCNLEAAQTFPPNYQTLTTGTGYTTSGTTNCTSWGNQTNCTSTPATYTPPTQTRIDTNMKARDNAYNLCMRAGGWELQRQK